MTSTVFEVAVPHCAAEVMDDEIVALNVETGIYFSIRELGVPLWNDLAAGHAVEDLAPRMLNAIGSDKQLTEFIEGLCRHGLMRPSSSLPSEDKPSLALALERSQNNIVFDVYDDMKDLILSDPIHDVDESRGWPHLSTPRT